MKPFDDLVDAMSLNHHHSPWAQEQTPADWLRYLQEETAEALAAKQSGQAKHLAEELGDVVQNWIAAVIALEDVPGFPSMETLLTNALTKLRWRKPWLFHRDTPFPKDAAEEMTWVAAQKAMESK